MNIFLLTSVNVDSFSDSNLDTNVEEVLNAGSAYTTLEAAQRAVQDDLDQEYEELAEDLDVEDKPEHPVAQWELRTDLLGGTAWRAEVDELGDTNIFLIRAVEVRS